jgi:hypothetical protein
MEGIDMRCFGAWLSVFCALVVVALAGASVSGTAAAASGLANSPWPKAGHDSENTSRTDAIGPQYGTIAWYYQATSQTLSSAAIDSEGNVRFAAAACAANGHVYVVSPTGDLVWQSETFAYNGPWLGDGVLLNDNAIVFGTYYGAHIFWGPTPAGHLGLPYYITYHCTYSAAPSGHVYAGHASGGTYFMAVDRYTGTKQWEYRVAGPTEAHNSIAGSAVDPQGRIYFGATDGGLYVLDPTGQLQWRYLAGAGSLSGTIPTIGPDGTVYFAAPVSGRLFAVQPPIGAGEPIEQWHFDVPGLAWGVRLALDTMGRVRFGDTMGTVYCLNPDGNVCWARATDPQRKFRGIALDGAGTTYIGSESSPDGECNRLYAVDPSGAIRWSIGIQGRNVINTPAIDNIGQLYFGSHGDARVWAIREWTLAAEAAPQVVRPGETVALAARTSMLPAHPLGGQPNHLQTVLWNGTKVALSYVETDSDGLSVWCGNFTVPDNTPGGPLPVVVEANAVDTWTDTPVHLDTPAPGSGNTGRTASVSIRVDSPPTIVSITGAEDPVAISAGLTVSGTFTDPDTLDTHAATWDWGDGEVSAGEVDQSARTVAGTHTYAEPGVYILALTVEDNCEATDTAEYRYVVVYNPDGGFVTGGGWINSPEGAYAPEPALAGKANFGFNSKYKKGATVPTGETEFQFKVGGLNFHSDVYQWLVIAGAKAKYKGSGTINGSGDYGFLLTAIDGDLKGSGAPDAFRIKIWDREAGDGVVYDNQMGAPDDGEDATVLGGGSIVIHKGDTTGMLSAGGAQITSASAVPTRAGAQITFTLSADADVSVCVLNIAGRPVRRLCCAHACDGGTNTLLWGGQADNGLRVPAGTYLISLTAQSPGGQSARALTTLNLKR